MRRTCRAGVVRLAALGAMVLLALSATPVSAWQTTIAPPSVPADTGVATAAAVAVDARNDVVAAGSVGDPVHAVVVKLDGADGHEHWRWAAPAPAATAVAIDAAGDVAVAAGVAVKLDGRTGTPLWTATLADSSTWSAVSVAFDPAGDLLVGGDLGGSFAVVKVSGTTGTELWRSVDPSPYEYGDASQLFVDAGGDVIAAGGIGFMCGRLLCEFAFMVKLAGADGSERWSSGSQASHGTAKTITLDPSGDVYVVEVGIFEILGHFPKFTVSRLASATAAPLWSRDLPVDPFDDRGKLVLVALSPAHDLLILHADYPVYPDSGPPSVTSLAGGSGAERWSNDSPLGPGTTGMAVTSTGNVALANSAPFAADELGAADGAELWRRSAKSGAKAPGPFTTHVLTVDSHDDLVVGGSLLEAPGVAAFSVLKLSGTDGALDVCGDGYVDPGEACDEPGLCCSAQCQPALLDGSVCDDGDACTSPDTCHGGKCSGGRIACEPCGRCDPSLGCLPELGSCRSPTETSRATIALRRGRNPNASHLEWDWRSGAATAKDDFGAPRDSTGYSLCVYDAATSAIVTRLDAPPGCQKSEGCWRRTRRGFDYIGSPGNATGLTGLGLGAGGPGRASITVRGRGRRLTVPKLPLPGVVVQLKRTDVPAMCWGASHDVIKRNRRDIFRAKGQ